MLRCVGQYVSTCNLCLCTKLARYSLVGKLHLLPVPGTCWDTLSIDFVIELPESASCDPVITVVDSMSKRVHFILIYTTVTAEGAIQLFFYHV